MDIRTNKSAKSVTTPHSPIGTKRSPGSTKTYLKGKLHLEFSEFKKDLAFWIKHVLHLPFDHGIAALLTVILSFMNL